MSQKKNLTAKEMFSIALENHQKNNLVNAEKLYKEILKKNPEYVDAHNNLGILFKELKKYEKAVNSYKREIQIQFNNSIAHNNLGFVFNQLGKYQNAIDSFKEAIKIEPRFSAAYYNLGNTYKILGKKQKAV